MDSRGFDTVARTIAGSGSRRGLMRAPVGTVTMRCPGPPRLRVAAQSDPSTPATRATDTQCVASGTTCDYVGQTDDFRCCGYEGAASEAMRIAAAGWSVRRATFPAPSVPMPVRVPAVTASPAPPAPVTTG